MYIFYVTVFNREATLGRITGCFKGYQYIKRGHFSVAFFSSFNMSLPEELSSENEF